jgi:hypothetical protein
MKIEATQCEHCGAGRALEQLRVRPRVGGAERALTLCLMCRTHEGRIELWSRRFETVRPLAARPIGRRPDRHMRDERAA